MQFSIESILKDAGAINDEAIDDEPGEHLLSQRLSYHQWLFQQLLQAWHYQQQMIQAGALPSTTVSSPDALTSGDVTSNSSSSASSASRHHQMDLPSFSVARANKCRERKPRQAYTTSQLSCLESEFKVRKALCVLQCVQFTPNLPFPCSGTNI